MHSAKTLDGAEKGLPLVVDVQPVGPRVVLRSKAIELGVSYALEGGASGIVVPWPGRDSFQTILQMTGDQPVWLAPASLDLDSAEIGNALDLGAAGIWLDDRMFAEPDPAAVAQAFGERVHVSISALS